MFIEYPLDFFYVIVPQDMDPQFYFSILAHVGVFLLVVPLESYAAYRLRLANDAGTGPRHPKAARVLPRPHADGTRGVRCQSVSPLQATTSSTARSPGSPASRPGRCPLVRAGSDTPFAAHPAPSPPALLPRASWRSGAASWGPGNAAIIVLASLWGLDDLYLDFGRLDALKVVAGVEVLLIVPTTFALASTLAPDQRSR